MKKKLPAFLLCLCLTVQLAACDQPASEGTGSLPPEGSPEARAPAESDASGLREGETTEDLSDILDEEQLALFEQASEFYGLTFGGDTSAIDTYREPIEPLPEPEEPAIERDGMIYQAATGYWADWDSFDRIVHTLFTDRFWTEKNEANGFPIYMGYNGRMYYISAAMGGGGHNDNFPDLYRLDGRTADTVSFTVIGHYSEMRPLEGESYEERDQRVATTYDYTLEFPLRLVLTGEGWRFDEFHSSRSASDINWMEFYNPADPADFETRGNEDGTITITRYAGSGGRVVIPSVIDGKSVSAIGNIVDIGGAFEGCTTVVSVVIPDGVTVIEDNAFSGCTALQTVTIPASVTLLRNCAFDNCPNLRTVFFEGDAPETANYVFDSTENVTIYYREGTSGWSNPWYGCPAKAY